MGLIKEFREFALRGNVIDLAVGVIIGGAFGTIVNSMVKDIIMPVVASAGNVDFSNRYYGLTEAVRKAAKEGVRVPPAAVKSTDAAGTADSLTAGAANVVSALPPGVTDAATAVTTRPLTLEEARAVGPVLAWGNFVTVTLNFIILAFCIFLMIKLINTARRRFETPPAAAAPPAPTVDQKLLTEIRDLLRTRA